MALTPRGIYYPDASAPPRRQDLQDLAESVDLLITPAIESAGSLGIAAAPNWSIASFTASKNGPWVQLRGSLTYTGATITGNATGNIANVSILTGVPVGWRPTASTAFPFYAGDGFGVGAVLTSGDVQLVNFHATAEIASGNTAVFNTVYLAAS